MISVLTEKGKTMINAKGENIYTNAEIAYELGLSPATVNAAGKRVFGNRIAHWTLKDAEMIMRYIKSISVEEDQKRLLALHEKVEEVFGDTLIDNDDTTRKMIDKDLHKVK